MFYSRAADRPVNQATVYHARLPGRRRHSAFHWRSPSALAAPRLRHRQPATMGHCRQGPGRDAALPGLLHGRRRIFRGTQYYLRLTADAYPEVMAKVQIRFGHVIPVPPEVKS